MTRYALYRVTETPEETKNEFAAAFSEPVFDRGRANPSYFEAAAERAREDLATIWGAIDFLGYQWDKLDAKTIDEDWGKGCRMVQKEFSLVRVERETQQLMLLRNGLSQEVCQIGGIHNIDQITRPMNSGEVYDLYLQSNPEAEKRRDSAHQIRKLVKTGKLHLILELSRERKCYLVSDFPPHLIDKARTKTPDETREILAKLDQTHESNPATH
ncbi:MAG: hypothetical protein MPJ50_11075 [Pirellulales bacterium]|nr:hypothetical protein [Pirellulales bacterium]